MKLYFKKLKMCRKVWGEKQGKQMKKSSFPSFLYIFLNNYLVNTYYMHMFRGERTADPCFQEICNT